MKSHERRDRILACAARLFAGARFDEVLMDDIARRAGVAKGTLYSYFEDKESLYFAVVFDGISKLNASLRQVAAERRDPEEQLRAVMGAIVSFFARNRFFFQLLTMEDAKAGPGGSHNRQRWQAERAEQIDVIESVLRQGVQAGVFAIDRPRLQAYLLRGMVRSALTGGEVVGEGEMLEVILGTFLGGVRSGERRRDLESLPS